MKSLDFCVLCLKGFDEEKEVQVHEKGLKKLIKISDFDLLWHAVWFFASRNNPRPNWSGWMMHITSQTTTIYESALKFFFIIDLNPLDETCTLPCLIVVGG